jgi:hypothetical protein
MNNLRLMNDWKMTDEWLIPWREENINLRAPPTRGPSQLILRPIGYLDLLHTHWLIFICLINDAGGGHWGDSFFPIFPFSSIRSEGQFKPESLKCDRYFIIMIFCYLRFPNWSNSCLFISVLYQNVIFAVLLLKSAGPPINHFLLSKQHCPFS